ncbi:hypothetical protein AVEN_34747-1 [Araneus ventricosus]|uniref:Uncharacterized protein n=1 Tax=Araneus ventricosus TaxID=182803 RepID=A0A4Y2GR36_ARAVE|nr:hypothetical protein AVEN_34747-1 [Araneus ventricosus]
MTPGRHRHTSQRTFEHLHQIECVQGPHILRIFGWNWVSYLEQFEFKCMLLENMSFDRQKFLEGRRLILYIYTLSHAGIRDGSFVESGLEPTPRPRFCYKVTAASR